MLKWFGRTRLWKWLASKYVAHFTFRVMGYPTFPIELYFELVDLMSTSKNTFYCFVSSDYASLASVLVRRVSGNGMFSHSGVILPGTARGTTILHMRGEGPTHEHLLRLLREVDYFAIIAVQLSPESFRRVTNKIQYILSNPQRFKYDYAQELENGKQNLNCSELIYALLDGHITDPDFHPRNLLGRLVFDPDQVAKIGKVVYTNHPELAKIT